MIVFLDEYISHVGRLLLANLIAHSTLGEVQGEFRFFNANAIRDECSVYFSTEHQTSMAYSSA